MARNYKLKKARPFLTFLVVLLVLCLLAMIFAFVWKLSDGFSDWSWFSSEDVEEVDEDILPDDTEEFDEYILPDDTEEFDSFVIYGFTSGESVVSFSD